MTTEQLRPPLRMPDHLFAELATGGGSSEALAFLERGERVRRLLLLRTLQKHLESLPTPLTPHSEAWRVLWEAADKAPEEVERLILAPQVGSWVAHILRRLHGASEGPPLWAEAGRLAALAVTAALCARTEADLLVPLTDGALHLPGLGMAQLASVEAGLTIGTAQTHDGELTLTLRGPAGSETSSPSAVLTCHPLTAPVRGATDVVGTGTRWIPLRTLTYSALSRVIDIPLDDLDPYRDLDEPIAPARLDADEAAVWQAMFDEAAGYVTGANEESGLGRLDPTVIRAVVPWGRTSSTPPPPPDVRVSATSGDSYGSMVIARPSSSLALAEAFVHEFQHSKLAALLHLFPLLDDDREECYYAPWRADPRHLTGLLHGAYAFIGVAGFWREQLADPEHAETAAYHFALRRLQGRLVVRTLLGSGRLTDEGCVLVAGLARTLDGWLREPVDRSALERARTAAALHRTEWRLRNVVPGFTAGDDRAALRFRTDRESWPDVRTYAFADRPRSPFTADEHLAAGDPAAAFVRYAEVLDADPAEPHALAGWIVARAALDPGRASRHMLARPELLRRQHRD
ncbi:HEXXH motif-containing putative peptide modification protein [Streptomyces sp. NBC_00988]|uniref:aKG-HExxH-type peptide beta-hydroxylase n=1 Tax=Streptomyces sp. NBC_00988 TaxID=2903704 RepID=UPI00386A2C03|nr:HEXXH motif-containing putative peptide modification protein [Streptomyces sp. NBC_00988]